MTDQQKQQRLTIDDIKDLFVINDEDDLIEGKAFFDQMDDKEDEDQ